MTRDDVRYLVIDWLHRHAPNLLADDEILEGLVFLCDRVWSEAERAGRRKLIEAFAQPGAFGLN